MRCQVPQPVRSQRFDGAVLNRQESTMNTRHARALVSAAAALTLCGALPSFAAPVPYLFTAGDFAVLGASTVTNTGSTTLVGNLGVYPGSSITGGGLITITGTVHGPDGVSQQAQIDALAAYNTLKGQSTTGTLTGVDLGGQILTPGVYFFASSAQLTGTLQLDAQGLADAQFVFQIGSALTTASASKVQMLNDNGSADVFWEIGSSATLGTTTAFIGSIIADQSITLNTGATIHCGRAIALHAAVTLDTNTISTVCPDTTPPTVPPIVIPITPGVPVVPPVIIPPIGPHGVPEPTSMALTGLALAAMAGLGVRRRRQGACQV
jgi:Ice-binding-like